MQLKEKLLSLGCFENNQYLDFYCTLIENNRETKKEKFKTQKHHIIPKCYYKLNGLVIDNSNDNLVNLLYSDHILVHYYLCLCVKDSLQLKYYLENSFLHLIVADSNNKRKIEEFNVEKLSQYQKIYEDWKELNSELQKGKTSWNKGLTKNTDERVRKYSKPRHFTEEHNKHIAESLRQHYKCHPGTMTGKHLPEDSKRKISVAAKGKKRTTKVSDATRKKLSEKTKQYWKNNPEKIEKLKEYNRTRVISTSTKEKIKFNQPTRRGVILFNAYDEIVEVFASISEASKKLGVGPYKINSLCKNGDVFNGIFTLKYEENE